MDETHEGPSSFAEALSRGEEDRSSSLPRALPKVQGQRLQEQACLGKLKILEFGLLVFHS